MSVQIQAQRRKTPTVYVGPIPMGSDHPIVIQSMTNTDTVDVEATAQQVEELANAGSELVRVTVNVPEAAQAVPQIKERLVKRGVRVPLIGDFHYNGHKLLTEFPDCAGALDKYRINPGNVGAGCAHDKNFTQMIEVAIRHNKPVRIGVNWGSLDQSIATRLMDENARSPNPKSSMDVMIDAMILSALESARLAERIGLGHDHIVISVKVSHVNEVVKAYTLLARECDYPLHVGLTEAGMGMKGHITSAAALAIILHQGIGDTIRVSLTPEPGGDRTNEVLACQHLLQGLGLRKTIPTVTSCPGCGRTTNTLFQEMAADMEAYFKEKVPEWRKKGYKGFEDIQVAVMGCIVNGPGESKQANIGISLPGNGENPKAPVFIDGKRVVNLEGPAMMEDFKRLVENYIERQTKIPV